MVILPKLRCPTCGRGMGPIKAEVVPPANTYDECLRRCPRCGVGATNAKNPAKVRYIQSDKPREVRQPKPGTGEKPGIIPPGE